MIKYDVKNRSEYINFKRFILADGFFDSRCIIKSNNTGYSITLCFNDENQIVHCCEGYKLDDPEILNEGILLNETKILHILDNLFNESKIYIAKDDESNFELYQRHYMRKENCTNFDNFF